MSTVDQLAQLLIEQPHAMDAQMFASLHAELKVLVRGFRFSDADRDEVIDSTIYRFLERVRVGGAAIERPGAFLRTSLRNACVDLRRRQKREAGAPYESVEEELGAEDAFMDSQVKMIEHSIRFAADRAVEAITRPEQRELFERTLDELVRLGRGEVDMEDILELHGAGPELDAVNQRRIRALVHKRHQRVREALSSAVDREEDRGRLRPGEAARIKGALRRILRQRQASE